MFTLFLWNLKRNQWEVRLECFDKQTIDRKEGEWMQKIRTKLTDLLRTFALITKNMNAFITVEKKSSLPSYTRII